MKMPSYLGFGEKKTTKNPKNASILVFFGVFFAQYLDIYLKNMWKRAPGSKETYYVLQTLSKLLSKNHN
jgi:uncharacterized PurR-regulated membrane protein YhhQ (DUF165 family)